MRCSASLAAAILGLAQAAGATSTFQGLGELPGSSSQSLFFGGFARGISSDGSVVVGVSNSTAGDEAYRWSASGGMTGLGSLPAGVPGILGFVSGATDASADGSVVVGIGSNTASNLEAFRWTAGTGMVGLGDLPGGSSASAAQDVSGDGSTIVGEGHSAPGTEAFRWTSGTGMVGLGDLAGGSFSSSAAGISADGSVVVGSSASANSPSSSEAFRWTSSTGMVGLGDLAGGSFGSSASGISPDGSIIVGRGISALGGEAFAWTASGGMIGLGVLAGYTSSEAQAVSADGSIVVGLCTENTNGTTVAVIWDPVHGMRNLRDVLESDYGLDLTGWELDRAWDVSADGRSIVGAGVNPDGEFESWLAVLPEPGSAELLLVFAVVALAARRLPRRGGASLRG
jgi:probable HAF family extracellular repeat protein